MASLPGVTEDLGDTEKSVAADMPAMESSIGERLKRSAQALWDRVPKNPVYLQEKEAKRVRDERYHSLPTDLAKADFKREWHEAEETVVAMKKAAAEKKAATKKLTQRIEKKLPRIFKKLDKQLDKIDKAHTEALIEDTERTYRSDVQPHEQRVAKTRADLAAEQEANRLTLAAERAAADYAAKHPASLTVEFLPQEWNEFRKYAEIQIEGMPGVTTKFKLPAELGDVGSIHSITKTAAGGLDGALLQTGKKALKGARLAKAAAQVLFTSGSLSEMQIEPLKEKTYGEVKILPGGRIQLTVELNQKLLPEEQLLARMVMAAQGKVKKRMETDFVNARELAYAENKFRSDFDEAAAANKIYPDMVAAHAENRARDEFALAWKQAHEEYASRAAAEARRLEAQARAELRRQQMEAAKAKIRTVSANISDGLSATTRNAITSTQQTLGAAATQLNRVEEVIAARVQHATEALESFLTASPAEGRTARMGEEIASDTIRVLKLPKPNLGKLSLGRVGTGALAAVMAVVPFLKQSRAAEKAVFEDAAKYVLHSDAIESQAAREMAEAMKSGEPLRVQAAEIPSVAAPVHEVHRHRHIAPKPAEQIENAALVTDASSNGNVFKTDESGRIVVAGEKPIEVASQQDVVLANSFIADVAPPAFPVIPVTDAAPLYGATSAATDSAALLQVPPASPSLEATSAVSAPASSGASDISPVVAADIVVTEQPTLHVSSERPVASRQSVNHKKVGHRPAEQQRVEVKVNSSKAKTGVQDEKNTSDIQIAANPSAATPGAESTATAASDVKSQTAYQRIIQNAAKAGTVAVASTAAVAAVDAAGSAQDDSAQAGRTAIMNPSTQGAVADISDKHAKQHKHRSVFASIGHGVASVFVGGN